MSRQTERCDVVARVGHVMFRKPDRWRSAFPRVFRHTERTLLPDLRNKNQQREPRCCSKLRPTHLPSYHRISDVSHSLAASDHPRIIRRILRRFSILRLCPPANERWCARSQVRDVVRLVKERTRPEPQKTSIARHPTARVQDHASVCMPADPSASAHSEEDSMLVEFTPLHPSGSSSSSSARPPTRRRRRPVDVLSALSNHALGIFIWYLATKYCAAAFAPTRSGSRGVLVALLPPSTTSKDLATSVMSKVRCSMRCASEPVFRLLLLCCCVLLLSHMTARVHWQPLAWM